MVFRYFTKLHYYIMRNMRIRQSAMHVSEYNFALNLKVHENFSTTHYCNTFCVTCDRFSHRDEFLHFLIDLIQ